MGETDTQTNRDRETVMAETKYETRMAAELRQRMQLWQRLEEGCKKKCLQFGAAHAALIRLSPAATMSERQPGPGKVMIGWR